MAGGNRPYSDDGLRSFPGSAWGRTTWMAPAIRSSAGGSLQGSAFRGGASQRGVRSEAGALERGARWPVGTGPTQMMALSEISLRHQAPSQRMHFTAS